MATVNFKAFKHHKKSDGTINVKLVVYHKGKRSYPDTSHYVTEKQLTKSYTFKDQDLIATLTKELADYRKRITDAGPDIRHMSVDDVVTILFPKATNNQYEKIDFIGFSRELEKEYRLSGQEPKANSIRAIINNLVDFMGTDVVYTSSITSDLLKRFEKFLLTTRDQDRNRNGNKKSIISKPALMGSSLFALMSVLKTVFIEARNKYNDEDIPIIRIPNYPFNKYKPPTPKDAKKRAIPLEFVKSIRDCEVIPGTMAELSKDMFMLSFYLCGMNAKDIFLVTSDNVKNVRLEYNRSKTKGKRTDNAFFSVKIIPEATVLLEKYIGKISKHYSSIHSFRGTFNYGNKKLKDLITVQFPQYDFSRDKLDFYAARHTFASAARNTLGFSVADIAEALNHKQELKITDIYIAKDWGMVDKIQASVVGLLKDDIITSEDL